MTYKRLDTPGQPQRFVSGIAVDPNDPQPRLRLVLGYEAYTPATPGHVFDVRYNPAHGTATWTNISYDLGDQPITDVEYDSATGDLYVAHRLRRPAASINGGTQLDHRRRGLPPVAVYDLTLASATQRRPAALRGDARPRHLAGRAAAEASPAVQRAEYHVRSRGA